MAVRKIVVHPAPVLRQKAKKVHRVDHSIKELIDDMVDTLHDANGAGLAAPQVGVPLRVIVTNYDGNLRVVVNPEIVEAEGEDVEGNEGCLSIPGWYGPVTRKERVVMRGLGRTGKPIKIKAEGWEARVFQHEVDHLNGVLYIDYIQDKSLIRHVRDEEEEEELEEEQAVV
jgi:peptide deformylase